MTMGAQIVLGLLLIVGLLLVVAMASEFLEAYLWQRRLLFVFSPAVDDDRLARQRAGYEALSTQAFAQALSLVVVGPQQVVVDGMVLKSPSPEAIRARFGVEPEEFRVILTSHKGEVLLSATEPQDMDHLLVLVDDGRHRGEMPASVQ